MSTDLTAELWSFAWILFVSGTGFLLHRKFNVGAELTRKFIHILVSLWAFILVYCYDDFWWAISGPVMFIFFNAFFGLFGFGRTLMGMKDGKRDIGLVCYPFSILILIILLYNGAITGDTLIASVLIMGFGDGLAAVVGSRWGRHRLRSPAGEKSIEGSLTMLAVSFIILASFTPLAWWQALTVAVLAMLAEFLALPALDNISVPLLSALFTSLFL